MAEGNDANGDGSSSGSSLENNGTQTPPAAGGNDDWKAKFEELQGKFTVLEQNRNHFRTKAEELETKNGELAKKVEDTQAEFSTYKDGVSKQEKTQAAKGKASDILAKYDDKVKKLAEISGLELADADDEDAIKAFTEKLDQIKENVGETTPPAGDQKLPVKKQPPVGGNNNSTTPPPPKKQTDEERLAEQEEKLADVTF